MKHVMLPLFLGVVCAACLPARLDKYRAKGASSGVEGPAPDFSPTMSLASKGAVLGGPMAPAPVAAPAPTRATIYAVDKQTYRFALREGEVWDAALDVLLRNYNLTIVDKTSGIVTTEWDSYYLNNEVFRNRVSLRIARSQAGVDMTIHNNVERLRDASQTTGGVGAVWLPADEPANEPARIVQNIALILGQPPPVLPPNSGVAAGVVPGAPQKR